MIDPEPVLKARLGWVAMYQQTQNQAVTEAASSSDASSKTFCAKSASSSVPTGPFCPNRPRAPHLNGKGKRSQRTDRMEFWAAVDLKAPREQLEEQ